MVRVARKLRGAYLDKDFFPAMISLAIPVMIQNFIASFLNMIDTVMVGKLGEIEIAAVGFANQYFFFFNMFLVGLSAGCSVFIAQFWGKKDHQGIKRILGVGLISALVVAIIFSLIGFFNPTEIISLFNKDTLVIDLGTKYLKIAIFSYVFLAVTFIYSFSLRSVGKAKEPMLISLVALVCNMFLNYVLIFGKFGAPALGVQGAALATVIARILETALMVAYIYYDRGVLAAKIRELLDLSLDFWQKAYRTIFPVILNDMCWGLAALVYIAVYGHMSTQAAASIQICNTANNLFMVVIFGLSSAATVMIGNSIGAGEKDRAQEYAFRFLALAFLTGIILGIILAFSSGFILSFFNVSTEVRHNAQIILYMISFIFVIRSMDIILIVGILRGGGDATRAFLIEGLTMWFIGVPLTIIGAFVFHFPVYIVYGLAIFEELFKFLFSFLRLRSGLWIKNVTENMV